MCRAQAKFHLVLCFKSQAQSWQGGAILKVRKLRPKEVKRLVAGGGCLGGRLACDSLSWGGRPGRGSQSRWGASAQVSLCGERGEAWLTGALILPQGTPENPGINQRALRLLFSEVQEKASDWEYTITVSAAEIYNEVLR